MAIMIRPSGGNEMNKLTLSFLLLCVPGRYMCASVILQIDFNTVNVCHCSGTSLKR